MDTQVSEEATQLIDYLEQERDVIPDESIRPARTGSKLFL